jgi:hypothetical protein
MNGSGELSQSPRSTLIPNPSPIATGEGSSNQGVGARQGLWRTVSAPQCHVLFVPWRWSVRVILPCDCGNVRTETE